MYLWSAMDQLREAHVQPPSSSTPTSSTTPGTLAPAKALRMTTSLWASTASRVAFQSAAMFGSQCSAGRILHATCSRVWTWVAIRTCAGVSS